MLSSRYTGRLSCLSIPLTQRRSTELDSLSGRRPIFPVGRLTLREIQIKKQENKIVDNDGITSSIYLSATNVKKTNNSYYFELLPPLSGPNDPNFATLFLKKVSLCRNVCLFNNDPTDKQVVIQKTITLHQFSNFYEIRGNARSIDEGLHRALIDALLSNVIHPIQTVDKRLMFFDTEPQCVTDAIEHIEQSYKVLISMYENVSERSIFTFKLFKRCLNMINSPDLRERKAVTSLIKVFINDRRSFLESTLITIRKFIMDFVDGCRTVFCIIPCLDLLTWIVSYIPSNDEKTENAFILDTILPLIHSHMFCMYHEAFIRMCLTLSDFDSKYADKIISVIVKYWPATDCMKEYYFMSLLNKIMMRVTPRMLTKLSRKLLSVLCHCTVASSQSVAVEAMNIWKDVRMKNFLLDNQRLAIELCTFPLVKVSKMHWDSTTRSKASSSLKFLKQLNKNIYNNVLEEVEMNTYKMEERRQRVNTWKTIVQNAKYNYPDISRNTIVGHVETKSQPIKPLSFPKISKLPPLRQFA